MRNPSPDPPGTARRFRLWTAAAVGLAAAGAAYALFREVMAGALFHQIAPDLMNRLFNLPDRFSFGEYLRLLDLLALKTALYALGALLFFRLPANVRLSVVSILALWLVLETAMTLHHRWLSAHAPTVDDPETTLWIHDETLGWKMAAGRTARFAVPEDRIQIEIRTNAHGLREEAIDIPKPASERRILLLGDSVTAGLEVSQADHFETLLEAKLAAHGNYRVLNAGVRGYGTDQSLLFFERQGRLFEPDLVLYTFVDNDPEDNITFHRPWRKFGKPCFVPQKDGSLRLTGVPVPESFVPHDVWRLSDPRIENLYNHGFGRHRYWYRHATVATLIDKDLMRSRLYRWLRETVRQTPWFRSTDTHASDVEDYKWRVTEALLGRLRAACDSSGARLLVYEFSPNGRPAGPPTRLAEACARLGIDYLETFETFYRLSEGRRVFSFLNDKHWNAQGHGLAGYLIYAALRERGWLDEAASA